MLRKKKHNFDFWAVFSVNRIVKYFILSDFMFMGGWGLIAPIFAIFVVQDVSGGNIIIVGATAALYWFVKSLVQIPVAIYIDRQEGERDDFHVLVFSLILSGFSSLAFLVVDTIPMLYLVVFLKAVAFGFYTPSWSAIFSRHLDRKRYAFDWSLDSTAIGISSGVAGLLGGTLAKFFGFGSVFVFVAILSFLAVLFILAAPQVVFPAKVNRKAIIRDHTPSNIQH